MKHRLIVAVLSSVAAWYFIVGPEPIATNRGIVRVVEPDEATCKAVADNIMDNNPALPVSQCLPVPTPTISCSTCATK